MKNTTMIFYTLFLLTSGIYSCTGKNNRISFHINPQDYRINIPVCIQDSITADMIFDTGAVDGAFRLDSTFVSIHPSLKPGILPTRETQLGSAWGVYPVRGLFYDTIFPVKVGNTTLNYNPVSIYDMKRALGITWSDGIFNMPKNDTTHIWEWNFEHNYLEIHPTDHFKMPANCYLFPMKTHGFFANYIQFPIKLKFDDGDTLTINQIFWVDAGMPNDIVILPRSEEWQFIDRKDTSRIKCKNDEIGRFYTVNAMLSDNFSLDSVRLYVVDQSYSVPAQYIVGLNFLKRFNLFFDRKHSILGFQKIKNSKRFDTGEVRPYYFSTRQTGQYSLLVTRIANSDDNIYKTAGLREGDEIIGYNNVELKAMTDKQYLEIRQQDTIICNIVRNGQSLKIEVVKNNGAKTFF